MFPLTIDFEPIWLGPHLEETRQHPILQYSAIGVLGILYDDVWWCVQTFRISGVGLGKVGSWILGPCRLRCQGAMQLQKFAQLFHHMGQRQTIVLTIGQWLTTTNRRWLPSTLAFWQRIILQRSIMIHLCTYSTLIYDVSKHPPWKRELDRTGPWTPYDAPTDTPATDGWCPVAWGGPSV